MTDCPFRVTVKLDELVALQPVMASLVDTLSSNASKRIKHSRWKILIGSGIRPLDKKCAVVTYHSSH